MVSSGRPSKSINDVLSVTTEINVASYYLNINKIPTVINSPLRHDTTPSLGIYSPDGRDVNYIDFGNNDRGSIYKLLSRIWNISKEEVYSRICDDFSNFKGNIEVVRHKSCKVAGNGKPSGSRLKCKVREWKDYDIAYWLSYGISIEWLRYAEVYPISHKIVVKGNDNMVFGADKYAYAYVEHKDGEVTLKIYQPYNKKGYKWANNHNKTVISLWTKVPEYGERICICSSLKDALCLWANTGIPALAIQGEGYGMSNTAVSELKRRYKNVYILLDNDEAGLIDGEKLSESTGFTNIVLPKEYGEKDISDFYKSLQNKETFKKIILNLFDNGIT